VCQHPPVKSIRSQAIFLATGRMAVTAMRFVLPMLLVRTLAGETYAAYRLVWLVVMSAEIIAPMGLPRSLLFFVPKTKGHMLRRYVFQSLMLITALGMISGGGIACLISFLPALSPLGDVKWMTAVFVSSWVGARLIEFLPSAEQRSDIQGAVIAAIEFVRIIVVGGVVLLSADLWSVLFAMVAFGLFKYGVQVLYIVRRYGMPKQLPRRSEIWEQLRFSVPMGLTFFLNNFRKLAEGWVVAFIFSPVEFAIYSIGAMKIPLVTLLRSSLTQVLTPRLSKAEAAGNVTEVFRLVRKANLVCFAINFPLVCFIWLNAKEIVALLFTEAYVGAAPVLQVYLFVMVKTSVDLTNIFLVFKKQFFIFRLNALLLPVSVGMSLAFSYLFGIVGAAAGSVVCIFIQTVIMHYKALDFFSVSIGELQHWGKLLVCALASLVAVLGSRFVWGLAETGPVVGLVGSGGMCIVLYGVFMYVFGLGDVLTFMLKGKRNASAARSRSEWGK